MALSILDKLGTGANLGNALSQGISNLLQYKMQDMSNQRQMQQQLAMKNAQQQMYDDALVRNLTASGIDPTVAQSLRGLNPELQAQAYKHELGRGGREQNALMASQLINSMFGGQQNQNNQSGMMPTMNDNLSQGRSGDISSIISGINQMNPNYKAPSDMTDQQLQKTLEIAKMVQSQNIAQEKAQWRHGQPERDLLVHQKKQVADYNFDLYKKAASALDNAKKNNLQANAAINLLQSGDVTTGKAKQALDFMGFGEWFRTNNDQLLDKLLADRATRMSEAFNTGKATNFMLNTYKQTFANRRNDAKTGIALAALDGLASQGSELKAKTAKQIKKDNKGILPDDYESMFDSSVEPELKRLPDNASLIMKNVDNIVEDPKKIGLPEASSFMPYRAIKDEKNGKMYWNMHNFWIEMTPELAENLLGEQNELSA